MAIVKPPVEILQKNHSDRKADFLKRLVPSAAIFIFLVCLIGFLLPFLVKPEFLEHFLAETVEQKTDYIFSVEHPRFSLFPSPSFEFSNMKIWSKREKGSDTPLVSALQVQCKLHLFPILFKRIEFSKIRIKGIDFEWMLTGSDLKHARIIQVRDASLALDDVRSNHWNQFNFEGKWLSDQPNIFIHGKAKANFEKWNLNYTAFQADVSLKSLSFSELLKWLNSNFGNQIDRGILKLNSKIEKTEGNSRLAVASQITLDDFVYRLPAETAMVSTPARYDLDLEAGFDLDNQTFSFKKLDLTAPFTAIKGKGSVDMKARKIEGVQLVSDSVVLDNLPNYFLPLAKWVPVNLGFSGEGELDLRLRGSLDQLFVNGKIDFTKALLTYSKFFIKPKAVPFDLSTEELVVQRGVEFDGGFNLTLKQTKMKGSLVKWNVLSKVGEVTFVTNLIPLEGWQEFLPTFSEYAFSGEAKFFANGKGNFEKIGSLVTMSHVALNQVSARSKSNQLPFFQNLNGSVDMGPLDLETKGFQFDFGETHFDVEAKMLLPKSPKLVLRVNSPALDLRNVVLQLQKVFQVLGLPAGLVDWDHLEKMLSQMIQPDTKLENFSVLLSYENKQLVIQALDFDVYGGHVTLAGSLDFAPKDPVYHLNLEVQRMSLARMFRKDLNKPVEGNLFLTLQLAGEGFTREALQNKLKGLGTISVTNGEFHTFDVLGSLGAIAQFTGLGQYVSGTTQFSDVNGKFQVGNGKIVTDHILLHSNDFDADTQGDIDFDGNINFRLDTVLSSELSRKIDKQLSEGNRLGPIPLMLTGKIDSPKLKPDPSLIQDFVQNLIGRKLGKILSNGDLLKNLSGQTAGSQGQAPSPAQRSSQTAQPKPGEQLVETGMTLLESLFQKRE